MNKQLTALVGVGLALWLPSAAAIDCSTFPTWNSTTAYTGGKKVKLNAKGYQANWWTQNQNPETHSGQWQEWKKLGDCGTTNLPPTSKITSPSNNAQFQVDASVNIKATATDPDGQVAKVTFLLNGTEIGQDSQSPYALTWKATLGNHQIIAKATDNKGLSKSSTAVSIKVISNPNNQAPTTQLTSPANGSNFTENDTVSIAATAKDNDGTISKVEFYIDDALVHSSNASPYTYSWTATPGSHAIYSKAFDNLSATGVSSTATISVASLPNNIPPKAVLISPKDGTEYEVNDAVSLQASASDDDGTIKQVEFFVDNIKVHTDTQSPYEFNWSATAGGHQIHARAVDDKDATGDSSSVAILVKSGPIASGCRPDGLYQTPNTTPNYCDVYDQDGRESMGADHPRRIIGYFTSWRNGANNQPSYLVNDIPWDKLTHINYAFAHVDGDNKVSVGNVNDPKNPATGMEWPNVPGAEMDSSYSFKGHFNLLNKFKKQFPKVKTLVSVGGWAESGGYFDDNGQRVNSGGFYTMTTNADNSVNTAGINAFADSVITFIRQYGFDGVDIDYEYPTSMKDAGNPDDFEIANARRAGLVNSYVVLMQTLRARLDQAGTSDKKHYLLTIASPSSGYLLRGVEVFQVTQFLDYVNIMTYDLHGAWNQFVGPNAALFDTGEDGELKAWNYYNTSQYKGIGYLNTDWAYHYFRGAMQAGRINIGVPYYTRGWRNVTGGTNGLWGTSALPDQNTCPPGTGGGDVNKCGYGAIGIDNIWHDLDKQGVEMGAGSNPMWHAKNLENGKAGSYIFDYGLDPANDPDDKLTGTYTRHYDSVGVTPWLWNDEKKVFLSTEDEQSIRTKADYIVERGIGGIMFWELAGDYQFNTQKNEYFMGYTLTNEIYNKFMNAAPYGNKRANRTMPTEQVDVKVEITGFKLGDQNYPINPQLIITNNTDKAIPGGSDIQFDVPTAIPDNISDQSGAGTKVIESGANNSGNNIGGLLNDFHRVSIKLKATESIAAGASKTIKINYYLPMPMPSNWTITSGEKSFALKSELPDLPKGEFPGDSGGGDGDVACSEINIDPATVNAYPNWTQTDWAGNPDHANTGDLMSHQNTVYKAKWWTSATPGTGNTWDYVCTF